ncbi:toll/interleukin-1 receptor domain-containing protein [Dyella sp. 333MFSha]|uniref:toll/interleukin-1 receptor domain-containing protein n=1 Tax=Dyella sp. 333MFSha TaxID=1798240 RepID=UPI000B81C1DE|nr:toll/interleukin-1 receptor domain-containing protein [Dyella sp. 333MFSha]
MESLIESAAVGNGDRFDVFLSHSSKDAEVILGIKSLLEGQGMSVYVDWIVDTQLDRAKVNAETAETLRKRMGQCKGLIYVASANAAASKWMPWELGYFDGKKGDAAVAILPVVERQTDGFPGQEYLGLYAVVRNDFYSDTGDSDVFVERIGKHWKPLREFANTGAWYQYTSKS